MFYSASAFIHPAGLENKCIFSPNDEPGSSYVLCCLSLFSLRPLSVSVPEFCTLSEDQRFQQSATRSGHNIGCKACTRGRRCLDCCRGIFPTKGLLLSLPTQVTFIEDPNFVAVLDVVKGDSKFRDHRMGVLTCFWPGRIIGILRFHPLLHGRVTLHSEICIPEDTIKKRPAWTSLSFELPLLSLSLMLSSLTSSLLFFVALCTDVVFFVLLIN